jgi:hypothetical protein
LRIDASLQATTMSYNSNSRNNNNNNHRYIVNGRIVSDGRPLFSWRRCILLLLLISVLCALNPANDPWTFHHLLHQWNLSVPRIKPLKRSLSSFRITNWGIVALEDGVTRIRLLGLGHDHKCYFSKNALCQPLKLVLHHRHPVYTCLWSIHALATLVALSCRNPRAIVAPTAVLQTLYTIFLPDLEHPLLSFLSSTVVSKIFLSTALEQMQKLLPMQSSDSLFAVSSHATFNLYMATAALIIMATGFAAFVRLLSNRRPRRGGGWHLLNSAALGYCTVLQATPLVLSSLVVMDTRIHLTAASASWLMLLWQLTFYGVPDTLEWAAAYYAGYLLGQYQLDNHVWASVARDVQHGWNRFLQVILGPQQQHRRY